MGSRGDGPRRQVMPFTGRLLGDRHRGKVSWCLSLPGAAWPRVCGQNYWVSNPLRMWFLSPIGKWRNWVWGVTWLAQVHVASEQWGQNPDLGLSDSKAYITSLRSWLPGVHQIPGWESIKAWGPADSEWNELSGCFFGSWAPFGELKLTVESPPSAW